MAVERPALVDRLAAFPARLTTAAHVATEPAAGEWSAAEVVRHLVAVEEEVWHARLDQLADAAGSDARPHWHHTEPRPRVLADPSLATALATFAELRIGTVTRLTTSTTRAGRAPAAMTRTGCSTSRGWSAWPSTMTMSTLSR